MTKLIYSACDGKAGDIKVLENSNYWDFCAFLNNYLERVEAHNKQVEKMQRENNISAASKRSVKSSKKK